MNDGLPELTEAEEERLDELRLRARTDLCEIGEISAGRDVVDLQLLARQTADRIAEELIPLSPGTAVVAWTLSEEFIDMLWVVGWLQPTAESDR